MSKKSKPWLKKLSVWLGGGGLAAAITYVLANGERVAKIKDSLWPKKSDSGQVNISSNSGLAMAGNSITGSNNTITATFNQTNITNIGPDPFMVVDAYIRRNGSPSSNSIDLIDVGKLWARFPDGFGLFRTTNTIISPLSLPSQRDFKFEFSDIRMTTNWFPKANMRDGPMEPVRIITFGKLRTPDVNASNLTFFLGDKALRSGRFTVSSAIVATNATDLVFVVGVGPAE